MLPCGEIVNIMYEVGPSPENIKIPESWDFLEKGRRDLKVIQLDKDERFLAFTLQKDRI